MADKYDYQYIENKWRQRCKEEQPYAVDLEKARRPYYNLMMFPYPSAEGLHIGNLFPYVGSDIHGRFRRAQGYDVFEPIGFDAFGMHSENHALKVGRHPSELIPENIAAFRRQLERINAMLDWRYEVNTTDPAYYRWTQWIFLQLYNNGLAYQKEAPVTWCPSCRTVLATEQAPAGICERCDTAVENRDMLQWFLRTTAYAQRLLDNLEWIDWSAITKNAQRQWIGRSEGAEITFEIAATEEEIQVFTTRPDTLWGATYLVLAPEHPLIECITRSQNRAQVEAYLQTARQKSVSEREENAAEKSGIFTGAFAVNPANQNKIPIWIADYVVMGYGTGAIMAVPAHDQRDFEFAQQFDLPIVQVIRPNGAPGTPGEAYSGEGLLCNSGPFNGKASAAARNQISTWLEDQGRGRRTINYRLRDWCISRQRYWGPPIPMIHCDTCGVVPVPEEELPVTLPLVEDFEPDGSGRSPLSRVEDFVKTHCPRCHGTARRETDVSDNFLDSAWYFLRYPSAHRDDVAFDAQALRKWLPVDMYIGGNEHAVLHLMYTRFLTMAFKDMGLIDCEEPFAKFRANGMIVKDGAKMSKSRGNVVNPDQYLDQYGADTLRTYLMFSGNFQEGGDFRAKGMVGIRRFLERLWHYMTEINFVDGKIEGPLVGLVHRQIYKVTQDLEALSYNTAIAALMELFNGMQEQQRHYHQAAHILLQLLHPFAPSITQELWERLGEEGWIGHAPWPQYDEGLMREEVVTWVVQVNGRVRDRLVLAVDTPREEVEKAVFARERIKERIAGRSIAQTVFVANKLLNIVVEER
jgi:leucyl-tRNA synthetase